MGVDVDSEPGPWWPNESEPNLSGWTMYLIADILGPVLNHELSNLLSDAERRGLGLSDEMETLRSFLSVADGRAPKMLAKLASAVIMAYEFERRGIELDDDAPPHVRSAFGRQWDVFKRLGDVVWSTCGKYGFTDATWEEFVRSPTWPPRGIGYRPYPT